MHLRQLTIQNFRALEDIQIEFDTKVSVIVGPNAAGKTTILEAIRLAKALLALRTMNEATQVLHALGIASPHVPQRIRVSTFQGVRLVDFNTCQLNHADIPQISGRHHGHWIAAAGLYVSILWL